MEVCYVKKRLMKKMMKRQTECAAEKQTAEACVAVTENDVPAKRNTAEEKTVKAQDVKASEVQVKADSAAAKPEAPAAKRCAAAEASESKGAAKISIFYQFAQHQVEQQDIIARIKNQWKAQGNLMKDLKDLVVYLKTEENKSYFVINNDIKGSIAAWE